MAGSYCTSNRHSIGNHCAPLERAQRRAWKSSMTGSNCSLCPALCTRIGYRRCPLNVAMPADSTSVLRDPVLVHRRLYHHTPVCLMKLTLADGTALFDSVHLALRCLCSPQTRRDVSGKAEATTRKQAPIEIVNSRKLFLFLEP